MNDIWNTRQVVRAALALLGLVAIVLLIIGAIFGCVLHGMLLTRLRFRHPHVWHALGSSERVFDDGGFASLEALRRFYWHPELRQGCSPETLAFAKFTQVYGRAYTGFAVVTFCFVIACLRGGVWGEL